MQHLLYAADDLQLDLMEKDIVIEQLRGQLKQLRSKLAVMEEEQAADAAPLQGLLHQLGELKVRVSVVRWGSLLIRSAAACSNETGLAKVVYIESFGCERATRAHLYMIAMFTCAVPFLAEQLLSKRHGRGSELGRGARSLCLSRTHGLMAQRS